ncbi:aminotransferase class I/II-fold pyridoxal phosphate-dependent enzyme [Actinotalea sp. M2MS4P-6]|uniref:pyridoxal phosphate-dependent aminotransferase n=1 Tax=Actinotalea sp. M2MS4P-6 TaxID=2983762 RepID=UPI0021E4EB73|nr:aminotransferase class I/II-fold pyridoxal phosphate-dependent enzyme [Actinotalea sp. M2MS4P-6]MCV2393736.1 aminotransferase class I/II-fold pyridoxal phosphate-dependent enzyme [Actinotalea sp. M2MS4P-6]
MKVARRSLVPPFAVMEVIAAANARRTLGHHVLNLCAGEPSAGAPAAVRARARQALDAGELGYTEALGMPALRHEIAGHYHRWYGVAVDPGQVAVTTGASGGFVLAFLAAFEAGDRVAVVRPGYPAYRNLLAALGCEVVDVPCGPAERYQPTPALLDAVVAGSGPLDGLILAGPANPTGTLIEPATLDALAQWCAEHGVRLVSDELYHGITYRDGAADAMRDLLPAGSSAGAPTAATNLDQGVVVAGSFSKYWAMTGWRLGWLLLPPDLLAPVDALAGNLALCPPTLSQQAATAAFTPEAYAEANANVATYERSRAVVLDRLADLGWRDAAPADGAFYVYADISAAGLDSRTYCTRLLAEADVALTPGTDFDPVDGTRTVRLSFATTPEVVGEAVDRIVAWSRTL